MAFGKTELSRELMWPGSGATAAVREAHRAKVSALLGMMPAAGTIGVLVTHGFVIHGVTELHVAEGEAIVVRPGGGGRFTVVGRMLPADWSTLAGGP